MWRMWRVSLMIVTHAHAHAHTCVKVNRETCHIRHNRHTRHPTTRFTLSHRCPLSLIPADLLAAPIVAAAVACLSSLGLTPADHAAAPSPALAALGGGWGCPAHAALAAWALASEAIHERSNGPALDLEGASYLLGRS